MKFSEIGVTPLGNFATLELDGKKIALLHGTHEDVVNSLVKCGSYDVVVRGHNHRAEIIRGKTLLINPGEVCGYLTGRQTVAILDLTGLEAEIFHL